MAKFVFGGDRETVSKKEKNKMLVTSIFSFSHNFLKRLLSQDHLNSKSLGKGSNECFSRNVRLAKAPMKFQY